jgi:DNA ligase (NAD+)
MVGRKLASNLVSVYPSLQELLRATYTELCEIEGIGEARAEQIVSDLSEIREVIEELISEKVGKTGTKISTGTGPLVGKTVVITGSIEGLDRRGAEESVKKLGGKVSSSVSLKTDLLIYGESAGSKFEKAKTLKVNTMSGEDFLKLLAENS